ncbi:hypothetical protein [Acidovorax phage AP1]|nr:hypothetical protein [Acidovorax phage AP1]
MERTVRGALPEAAHLVHPVRGEARGRTSMSADTTLAPHHRPSPYRENKRRICAENWDATDAGCGRCQIVKACHSGPTARLSRDDLDQFYARVNAAADQVISDRESPYPDRQTAVRMAAKEAL